SSTYTGWEEHDFSRDMIVGSVATGFNAPFEFTLTIDGDSYTAEDFAGYLTERERYLSDDVLYESGSGAATMGDLADWIETLDGVESVTFSDGGWTIAYAVGVQGTV